MKKSIYLLVAFALLQTSAWSQNYPTIHIAATPENFKAYGFNDPWSKPVSFSLLKNDGSGDIAQKVIFDYPATPAQQSSIASDEDLQGIWYRYDNKVIIYYHQIRGTYYGTLTYMDPSENQCMSKNEIEWSNFIPPDNTSAGSIDIKNTDCNKPSTDDYEVSFRVIDNNTIIVNGVKYNRKF